MSDYIPDQVIERISDYLDKEGWEASAARNAAGIAAIQECRRELNRARAAYHDELHRIMREYQAQKSEHPSLEQSGRIEWG